MMNFVKFKKTKLSFDKLDNFRFKLQRAMIQLKIKVKLILTVEGHVMPVQLVMMEYKIKVKLTSIVEVHAKIAVRIYVVFVELNKFYI